MGPKEHERRGASDQHTDANRDRLPGNLWPVARRKPARAAAVAQERHAGIDLLASTLERTDQILNDNRQRHMCGNLPLCERALPRGGVVGGIECDDYVAIRVHWNARERGCRGCLASCIPQNDRGLTRLGRGNQVIDRVDLPRSPLIADRTDLPPKRVIGGNEKHRQLLPFYRRRRATLRWGRGGRVDVAYQT